MKAVQHPRGPADVEDAILGLEGQLRVDLSGMNLRLHDGQRMGGHKILTESGIRALLAQGAEGQVGKLAIYATANELSAAIPSRDTIALCLETGSEAFYYWSAGLGDQTSIPSAESGSWTLLDSGAATVMRLWQGGFIYLVVDTVPPDANQDKTAWITDGQVMLWDGSEYVASTPELFAAMLAAIGGYATGSFILPNRLQANAVLVTDANSAVESGWSRGAADATNRPGDFEFLLETRARNSNNLVQMAYALATDDTFIRRRISGTWGTWALIESLFDPEQFQDIPFSKVTGTVPVEQGGTGGATPEEARENLEIPVYEVATESVDGLMAAEDVVKLNGIEPNAEVNPDAAEIKTLYESNADTNAFTDAQSAKLAGIAAGATANDSDANLKDRANHTGTQDITTTTTGTLPVNRGGTGQTTEAGMRGVYTGSTRDNTNYPIGTVVFVRTPSIANNRNATLAAGFQVSDTSPVPAVFNLAGNLTGTWRSRGAITEGASASVAIGYLVQRVA